MVLRRYDHQLSLPPPKKKHCHETLSVGMLLINLCSKVLHMYIITCIYKFITFNYIIYCFLCICVLRDLGVQILSSPAVIDWLPSIFSIRFSPDCNAFEIMTWARRLNISTYDQQLWMIMIKEKAWHTHTHQFLTCFISTQNPSRIATLPSSSTIAKSTLTTSPFELPHIDQFDSNFPANNLCHGHRSYANLGGIGVKR